MEEKKKSVARVVKDYSSPYHDSFSLKMGEELSVSPKKSEWPGWIWCTNKDNESRWVPQSYIEIDGNKCRMLVDYNAVELPVREGETLTILFEESDWGWCVNSRNEKGWVPLRNVRKTE